MMWWIALVRCVAIETRSGSRASSRSLRAEARAAMPSSPPFGSVAANLRPSGKVGPPLRCRGNFGSQAPASEARCAFGVVPRRQPTLFALLGPARFALCSLRKRRSSFANQFMRLQS